MVAVAVVVGLVVGFGGFASYVTVNSYPHNLFLELLCETGVVGAAVFILLLLRSLVVYRRNRALFIRQNRFDANLFSLLVLVFAVGNSMVSGNLASNEYVGFSFALIELINVVMRDQRVRM